MKPQSTRSRPDPLDHPSPRLAPGTAAPDFKGTDSNGAQHSLSQYRGKYVVLEWANKGCPYDQKHYLSGSMETCKKSGPPKESSGSPSSPPRPASRATSPPPEENNYLKSMHAAPTAVLLDPDRRHRPPLRSQNHARTSSSSTPPANSSTRGHRQQAHHRSGRPQGRAQLPQRALNAAMAGKPVAVASTRPYGCSVKYAH